MNVKEAFQVLMDALHTALEEAKKSGAEAMLEGRLEEVNTALVQAEALKSHLAKVKELQENWDSILKGTDGRKRRGRPAGAAITKPVLKRPRATKGTTTPQSSYRLPILEALVELGGRAQTKDVLDLVGKKMKGVLMDKDYELHRDGRAIRWRNAAQWVRNELKEEGLLKSDSPSGIWEITEKGWEYIRENKGL
ncbi:MAG: hypothetical protein HUU38_16955 [Anaerolineales bacterium]|nr:hypothetical protein [Anaerolineales bacterium]